MRAIWKGSISFGLVNIPIALYPATRREELRFHLLRKSDMSRVNNRRVAAADGKEVPWEQIVKGYEYEKGKFVVLNDEDFARVDIEATNTVDITDFVKIEEVSPTFFYKPYFMEPEKGGDKAYALLREALKNSGKIGIATVVIRTRQYLAAVKPQGAGLMLELMHFANELVDTSEFKIPQTKEIGRRELQMAESLIVSMSGPWEPEKYHDEYRDALKDVIEEKIEHPEKATAKPVAKRKPTNVIDLVSVLQESLAKAGAAKPAPAQKRSPKKAPAKKKATAKRTSAPSKGRSASRRRAA